MVYLARTPRPPLDRFVERIWYCSDAPTHARERVLPSGGSVDLAVSLVEDEMRLYDPETKGLVRTYSGAVVSGISTRAFVIDPRMRASLLGVHFRPGVALPFFGISPAEIVDDRVKLEDLWGSTGRNLYERLLEARCADERFQLLEASLLRQLQRARPGHPAVHTALDAFRSSGNSVRVAEVAEAVGLSHRRFVEVFTTEVGLTPKFYARLQRFHCVKQRIAAFGEPESWATFAVACGYFDQSHMIRDFVEFSGMSPTGYLRSRSNETMFDHFVHAYRPP